MNLSENNDIHVLSNELVNKVESLQNRLLVKYVVIEESKRFCGMMRLREEEKRERLNKRCRVVCDFEERRSK